MGITIRTGVPGHGKTLNMVQELAKLLARWDKHPEEGRPIFVRGIPNLALSHADMPGKLVPQSNGIDQFIPDWEAMPDGSLCLFDEAQGTFPPRSSQSIAPKHVAFLNVHRHRGFDIWVTTQHPKLIDHSLRALAGKHLHFRRLFGGQRAMIYEWDSCSDGLTGMKNAVTSYWSYPKKVFDWYKSAEVHTKQKFKLPWWVWIPVISLCMGLYFVPKAYAVLSSGMSGKGLPTATVPVKDSPKLITPVPGQTPVPAPAPVAQNAAVEVVQQYVGCMASEIKCSCLTTSGVTIVEPPNCRESAGGFGHLIKVAMNVPAASSSFVEPVHLAKTESESESSKPAGSVVTLSPDGHGVLGKAPTGVRQPGQ